MSSVHGTLDDLRGRHDGKSAVVMGAGPSLRHIDERIHRHITIAVNSAIMKVPDSDYYVSSDPNSKQRPDYKVSPDSGTTDLRHWDYVKKGKCVVVVPRPFLLEGALEEIEMCRVVLFDKDYEWRLARDANRIIFGAGSVHCAVHVAVIMGCTPIYLIGNECCYKDGKCWFWQYLGEGFLDGREGGQHGWAQWQAESGLSVQPGEYGPGWNGRDCDGYLGATFMYWKKMAEVNRDIDIRDASSGRLRRVFPQVTVEGVLGV